jgi:hypothetical protein
MGDTLRIFNRGNGVKNNIKTEEFLLLTRKLKNEEENHSNIIWRFLSKKLGP